jgi:hypothetical protein
MNKHEELKRLAEPLNKWLQENYSPMHKIIVTFDGAEVVAGCIAVPFEVND